MLELSYIYNVIYPEKLRVLLYAAKLFRFVEYNIFIKNPSLKKDLKKYLTIIKKYAILKIPRIGRVFFMRLFYVYHAFRQWYRGRLNAAETLCLCRGRVSLR